MALSLQALAKNPGPSVYYTPGWHRLMETHMRWLREQVTLRVVEVQDQLVYKFEGDLFGLLRVLGIDDQYHWLTMRLNGMNSPLEFDKRFSQLKLPSPDVVDRIMSIYRTAQKKMT